MTAIITRMNFVPLGDRLRTPLIVLNYNVRQFRAVFLPSSSQREMTSASQDRISRNATRNRNVLTISPFHLRSWCLIIIVKTA